MAEGPSKQNEASEENNQASNTDRSIEENQVEHDQLFTINEGGQEHASDCQMNDVHHSTCTSGSEESDEEQNKRISVLNGDTEMATALQKNHFEVLDIMQLELQQVKDKNKQLTAMLERHNELFLEMKHRVCKYGHAVDHVGGDLRSEPGTLEEPTIVSQLRDEIAFYQNLCREQREQISQLKEKWKQSEQEKQELQGFLLQQRLQEISNSLSESELSRMKYLVRPKVSGFKLGRIREGSELFEELESRGEFTCSYVKDLLKEIHRFDLAKKLGVSSNESPGSSERHSNSAEEGYRVVELPGRSHDADEMQENMELARGTEVNEEVSGWNNSSGNSSNSEGDIVAFTDNADFENSSESSSVGICNAGLSSESSGSASSSSSQSSSSSAVSVRTFTADTSFSSVTSQDVCNGTARFTLNSAANACKSSSETAVAVTSSGEGVQEMSVSSFTTDEEGESGDMRGACAAKDDKSEEISDYFVSLHKGAVKTSHLNDHFGADNAVVGPVCSPDRAQDSLNLEHFAGVKQDALPDGDATEKQNGSGARIGAQKDTVVDQPDSILSNQSNKWEHLGARPRDRPPIEDRSSEAASLYSSFVDLVPQQVAGSMGSGVADAFLARHSEDKNLHESLYYSNTEKVLAEDSSLQGASYVDGMMNLNDSNKAKPYFGDCQVASRPSPYYTSHFPVLPLAPVASSRDVLNTSGLNPFGDWLVAGANREGNSAGNSSSSWLIPGANTDGHLDQCWSHFGSSVMSRDFGSELVESRDSSLIEIEHCVGEACAMEERGLRVREGREEFGREIERKECEIRAERERKKRESEARELQEASRRQQFQEERRSEADLDMWLQNIYSLTDLPFADNAVESLDSTHNSALALLQGLRRSRAAVRSRARIREFNRWWCTCAGEEVEEEANPICAVCGKHRYLGPCSVRPTSAHNECCVCLEDTFSGCLVLPCSHKVHRECIISLIQDNVLHCPACGHPLFPVG